MCLILFAFDAHPRYRLVVAANRDEWFHRETESARFWDEDENILAGRDLAHRGTWMGITRTGRFAAVTNFREPDRRRPDAKSRGALVSGFLRGSHSPGAFVREIHADAQAFNGFNFLAADRQAMAYFSNRVQSGDHNSSAGGTSIAPGIYGLSNHLLDTDWPKVRRGKMVLQEALRTDEIAESALFGLLAHRGPAPDAELPRTGVPADRERGLSAAHVLLGEYGTRSATVLLVERDGWVRFAERSFDQDGALIGATAEQFRLAS